MKEIKKIWIIRLDRLGDLLLTLPSLFLLKQEFPTAKLTIVVHTDFVKFLENLFPEDEIIGISRKWSLKKLKDILAILKISKHQEYDLALDLFTGTNHLSSLLLWQVSAKEKSGYGVGLRKYFLKTMIPPASLKYEADMVYDVLKSCGIKRKLKKRIIWNCNQNMPKKYALNKYIVIHPWASEKEKEWPYFEKLLIGLINKTSYSVVCIGSQDEKIRSKKLLKNFNNSRILDLTGECNLTELCSLIADATLFIGNNSGPMHIASLSGVPTIVLCGYSSKKRWILAEKHVVVMQSNDEDLEEKNERKNTLASISVEAVQEKIQAIL